MAALGTRTAMCLFTWGHRTTKNWLGRRLVVVFAWGFALVGLLSEKVLPAIYFQQFGGLLLAVAP